ncbi:MAG: hypothetical protein HZA54_08955, partial [Planctomycetes bacterium]|nr:hypothetical protein [Planctomycetota bacterium]
MAVGRGRGGEAEPDGAGAVEIVFERHLCEVVVTGAVAGDTAAGYRRRVERVARQIGDELAGRLAAILPASDEVVLVRRVEVEVEVSPGTLDAFRPARGGGATAAVRRAGEELGEAGEPFAPAAAGALGGVTQAWARAVSAGVARRLEEAGGLGGSAEARGGAGAGAGAAGAPLGGDPAVVRFPDRAAYVACFLSDLLRGRAWSRWFYGTFASLQALPTHAAAETLLGRWPREIGEVLVRLAARGDAAELAELVGETGCHALVRQAAEAAERAGGWPIGEALRIVVRTAGRALDAEAARRGGGEVAAGLDARGLFSAWIEALGSAGGARERLPMAAVITLLDRLRWVWRRAAEPSGFAAYLAGQSATVPAGLAEAVGGDEGGLLRALREAAREAEPGWLAGALGGGEGGSRGDDGGGGSRGWFGPTLSPALPRCGGGGGDGGRGDADGGAGGDGGRGDGADGVASPFLGVALLLGPLAELGLWEALRGEGVDEEPARAILLATLLAALGGAEGRMARMDAALAALVGCVEVPGAEVLHQAFAGPGAEVGASVQEGLVRRLVEGGRVRVAPAGALLVHVAPEASAARAGGRRRCGVLQDAATGFWCGLGAAGRAGVHRLLM